MDRSSLPSGFGPLEVSTVGCASGLRGVYGERRRSPSEVEKAGGTGRTYTRAPSPLPDVYSPTRQTVTDSVCRSEQVRGRPTETLET